MTQAFNFPTEIIMLCECGGAIFSHETNMNDDHYRPDSLLLSRLHRAAGNFCHINEVFSVAQKPDINQQHSERSE